VAQRSVLEAPPAAPAPPEAAAPETLAETEPADPGWTELTPIASSIPPMPRIASAHFSEDLASWKNPTVSLLPLSHRRSEADPAGEVTGIAQIQPTEAPSGPVDAPQRGALDLRPQPSAPVQREAATAAPAPPPPRPSPTIVSAPTPVEAAPAPIPSASPPTEGAAVEEHPEETAPAPAAESAAPVAPPVEAVPTSPTGLAVVRVEPVVGAEALPEPPSIFVEVAPLEETPNVGPAAESVTPLPELPLVAPAASGRTESAESLVEAPPAPEIQRIELGAVAAPAPGGVAAPEPSAQAPLVGEEPPLVDGAGYLDAAPPEQQDAALPDLPLVTPAETTADAAASALASAVSLPAPPSAFDASAPAPPSLPPEAVDNGPVGPAAPPVAAADEPDAPTVGTTPLSELPPVLPVVEAPRPTLLRDESPPLVYRELGAAHASVERAAPAFEALAAPEGPVAAPPTIQREPLAVSAPAPPATPAAPTAATPPGTSAAPESGAPLLGERPIEPSLSAEPEVEADSPSGADASEPTLDLAGTEGGRGGRRGIGEPLVELPETARPFFDVSPAADAAALYAAAFDLPLQREPLAAPAAASPVPAAAPETPPTNMEGAVPLEELAWDAPSEQFTDVAPPAAAGRSLPTLGERPLALSLPDDELAPEEEAEGAAPPPALVLQLLSVGEAVSHSAVVGDTRIAPAQWPWRAPASAAPATVQRQTPPPFVSAASSAMPPAASPVGGGSFSLPPPPDSSGAPAAAARSASAPVKPTFLPPVLGAARSAAQPAAAPPPAVQRLSVDGGVTPPRDFAPHGTEGGQPFASPSITAEPAPEPFGGEEPLALAAPLGAEPIARPSFSGPEIPPSPAVRVALEPASRLPTASTPLQRSALGTALPTTSLTGLPRGELPLGAPQAASSAAPRATATLVATEIERPSFSVQPLPLSAVPQAQATVQTSSLAAAPQGAFAPSAPIVRSGTQEAEPPTVQRFLGQLAANFIGNPFSRKKPEPEAEPEPEPEKDEPAAEGELTAEAARTLASKIYPYISQKLKAELGRDRERAGMITGLHR